jgi:hypothetical protein
MAASGTNPALQLLEIEFASSGYFSGDFKRLLFSIAVVHADEI